MFAANIILDSASAALFLGVSVKTMNKFLPAVPYYYLDQLYNAPVPPPLRWTDEDEPILMLRTSPHMFAPMLMAASFPHAIPRSLLDHLVTFLTEAPFHTPSFDVVHYLNDEHLHKYKQIDHVALELSRQGFFDLKAVPKSDKRYQELIGPYYNPPILARC